MKIDKMAHKAFFLLHITLTNYLFLWDNRRTLWLLSQHSVTKTYLPISTRRQLSSLAHTFACRHNLACIQHIEGNDRLGRGSKDLRNTVSHVLCINVEYMHFCILIMHLYEDAASRTGYAYVVSVVSLCFDFLEKHGCLRGGHLHVSRW